MKIVNTVCDFVDSSGFSLSNKQLSVPLCKVNIQQNERQGKVSIQKIVFISSHCIVRKKTKLSLKPTSKPLSNGTVVNGPSVSVIGMAFSKSPIDGAQVQVDSIVQVKRY